MVRNQLMWLWKLASPNSTRQANSQEHAKAIAPVPN